MICNSNVSIYERFHNIRYKLAEAKLLLSANYMTNIKKYDNRSVVYENTF